LFQQARNLFPCRTDAGDMRCGGEAMLHDLLNRIEGTFLRGTTSTIGAGDITEIQLLEFN